MDVDEQQASPPAASSRRLLSCCLPIASGAFLLLRNVRGGLTEMEQTPWRQQSEM